MKRAPLVVTGTIAGLAGVLAFHSSPSKVTLGTTASGSSGTASSAGSGSSSGTAKPSSGKTSSSSSSGTSAGSVRSATGPSVNYNYGILSVKVTVAGTKITKVTIASIDDGGMPRSQFIDQQAIPILERQALAAQSANIQGVSGASFTSAGFAQSLQGALRSLGLK